MNGTGTYLDDLDDDGRVDETKVVEPAEDTERAPADSRPAALGITVDMTVHGEAFRKHQWKIYYEPGTQRFAEHARTWAPPPKPAVRARPAEALEVPGEAAKAATAGLNAGRHVTITFARSGEQRVGPDRGRCRCGAVVRLYKESGFVMPHAVPVEQEKVPCTGAALNWLNVCETCGQKAKPLKRGGLSKHYLKVEQTKCTNEQGPDEVLPGEPLPATCSVVVRVRGVGAGVWVDGKFDVAFLRGYVDITWATNEKGKEVPVTRYTVDPDGPNWVLAGADDFQRACSISSASSGASSA